MWMYTVLRCHVTGTRSRRDHKTRHTQYGRTTSRSTSRGTDRITVVLQHYLPVISKCAMVYVFVSVFMSQCVCVHVYHAYCQETRLFTSHRFEISHRNALWCCTASFAQFGCLFRTLLAKIILLINIHIEQVPATLINITATISI